MIVDELLAVLDTALLPRGAAVEEGEEYRQPPLDIVRYYRRELRLSRIPWFGRALSVVAVARQPIDVGLANDGYRALLKRVALAANGRFPLWRGLTIGLTVVVLTPEPIGPGEEQVLQALLAAIPRTRAVAIGLVRVNLGQEACSFALSRTPDNLFAEPELLADHLSEVLRRFVPFLET